MFGTIRRHQKWLWILISGLTIISFVAFFSPNRRRQGGWVSPHDVVGSINGRPITKDHYNNIVRESRLAYLFANGRWPEEDAANRRNTLEAEVRNRLFLASKLNEMDVQVSEAAVAQWIRESPAFHDPRDKQFRMDGYERFVKEELPRRGLTESDFERFAKHEVGTMHLVALAGTAGKLVTPQEAEALYRRENQEIEAEAIFVYGSNYLGQVTVDPAALATYYTNQQALYRIPEKTQISYVKFAATNYLAEADQELGKQTNLNQLIEGEYLRQGTNSASPETAKQKIREDFRQQLALKEARKRAVDFTNALADETNRVDVLERMAAAKGLVATNSEPFLQYQTPPGMNLPPAFNQIVAKLTPEDPIPEMPVIGEDAVYVIELKNKIPSEVPPLDTIRDRVTEDYKNSKAVDLAQAAGRELQPAITNAMAGGKTFEAAVAEKNVSPVVVPPFSRKTRTLAGVPPGQTPQLISKAFSVSPGKVSDFVPVPRVGGFLVYVKALNPVPDSRLKQELPEFTKTLAQQRQYEAFYDWFKAQEAKAQVVLVGDKQRASAK